MKIPYEKIMTVIADSYQIYRAPIFTIPPEWGISVTITLKDYISANISTPVLHSALKREYRKLGIVDTYFLDPNKSLLSVDTIGEALRWYYEDMSNIFYVKGTNVGNTLSEYHVNLDINAELLQPLHVPTLEFDFDVEAEKVYQALQSRGDTQVSLDYTPYIHVPYSDLNIVTNILEGEDVTNSKFENFVVACILAKYSNRKSILTVKKGKDILI